MICVSLKPQRCMCKVAGMCVIPGSWNSACIRVLVPVSTLFFFGMYVFCSLVLPPNPLQPARTYFLSLHCVERHAP